jgi:putative PIN family toxin of toxin-antitoxin system
MPGPNGEVLLRAVVDVNVLIAAALSPRGPSAQILRDARDGAFEPVVSGLLLAELRRALSYPKLRERISPAQGAAFVGWIRHNSTLGVDPPESPPIRSPDPEDDYLLALAISERAFLVTRDQHLLGPADGLPILTPEKFLARLRDAG